MGGEHVILAFKLAYNFPVGIAQLACGAIIAA
jgi:hypothetical protein